MKIIFGYWYTFVLVVALFLGAMGFIEPFEGEWGEAPLSIKVFLPLILLTFFGFWIAMLGDFFKHKDVKHPVAVGFSLIMFNWIASLIYFWCVVNKRGK